MWNHSEYFHHIIDTTWHVVLSMSLPNKQICISKTLMQYDVKCFPAVHNTSINFGFIFTCEWYALEPRTYSSVIKPKRPLNRTDNLGIHLAEVCVSMISPFLYLIFLRLPSADRFICIAGKFCYTWALQFLINIIISVTIHILFTII